jgi:tetratricopeptide (TPR) repeat protein
MESSRWGTWRRPSLPISVWMLLVTCAAGPADKPAPAQEPKGSIASKGCAESEAETQGSAVRTRSDEEFAYCDDFKLPGELFQRQGATRFLVVDFRTRCENSEAIRLGRVAATTVEQLLNDHLVRVATPEPDEQIQLMKALEVARLRCVVKDDTAALAVGKRAGADLVLWGDAMCSLRTPKGQPMVNITQSIQAADQSQIKTGDIIANVHLPKGEIGSFCVRATLTSSGWPTLRSSEVETRSAEVLEGGSLELPQVVSGDALGLTLFVGGLHFYKMKDHARALRLFRGASRTLRTDSKSAVDLLWVMGATEHEAGRFDQAAEFFSQCEALVKEKKEKRDRNKWWACRMVQVSGRTLAGEIPQALALAQDALKRARAEGRLQEEAIALGSLGGLAMRKHELDQALAWYQEALPKYQAAGAEWGEASTLQDLGALAMRKGELAQARKWYEAAREKYQALGEPLGEAHILRALGGLALHEAEVEKSRRYYAKALELYRDLGDQLGEANTLADLGEVALLNSELDPARESYTEALSKYQAVGNRQGEANALMSLGNLAQRNEELEPARQRYNEALEKYRAIGDRQGEANTLLGLGELALFQGEVDLARQRCEEALKVYRAIGDPRGEAHALRELGRLALLRKELELARQRYEEALPKYQALGDQRGEANTLLGLGELALHKGEWEKAGERYKEALEKYQAIGDRLGEANTFSDLGDLALRKGELEKAGELYKEALEKHRTIGNRRSEANTLSDLGELALRVGELDQARQWYEEALPKHRALGHTRKEADVLLDLGEVARRKGELDPARERYEEALKKYRALGNRRGEAGTLAGLADLATARKKYSEADPLYRRASSIFAGIPDPYNVARTDWRFGVSLSKRGETQRALEVLEKSLFAFIELGDRGAATIVAETMWRLENQSARSPAP